MGSKFAFPGRAVSDRSRPLLPLAAVFAIIAFTTFVTGSLAGLYNIWAMMAFIQAVCLFAAIVLRVWNVPDNLKWAAYFLLGFMGAPNPLFFG